MSKAAGKRRTPLIRIESIFCLTTYPQRFADTYTGCWGSVLEQHVCLTVIRRSQELPIGALVESRRDVVSRYVYSNRSLLSREAQWAETQWAEDTKRLKPIRRVAGQAVVGTFQNVGLCIVQAEVSIEPPHR